MRLIEKLKIILLPLSYIYSLVIFLRNLFYDRHIFKIHSLEAKVISVGNITWGGTGKTPTVGLIADLLMSKGRNCGVLLRGYGEDEYKLLPLLAPGIKVYAGANRLENAFNALSREKIDTFILDDGFQHRKIKRDLDIVCIDAAVPFGNGSLIPAGQLRESTDSLKRAHIFMITKTGLSGGSIDMEKLENKLKSINPKALIVKTSYSLKRAFDLKSGSNAPISALVKENIALLSAIGNPASFEHLTLKLGIKFKKHFIFRDHYLFKRCDIVKINSYCKRNNITTILTTEKDAVKLQRIKDGMATRCVVLSIEEKILDNFEGFRERLFSIYNT